VFRDGRRTVTPLSELGAPVTLDPIKNRAIARLTGAVTGKGPVTIAQVGRTTLAIHSVVEKKSLIGPTTRQESSASLEIPFEGEITALRLDGRGEDLFIGTSRGQLVWYDMRDAQAPKRAGAADASEAPITALGLLIGDRTLVVGDGQGGVSTWQLVPGLGGGERRLTRVHGFQGHHGPVVAIDASKRDKGFATAVGLVAQRNPLDSFYTGNPFFSNRATFDTPQQILDNIKRFAFAGQNPSTTAGASAGRSGTRAYTCPPLPTALLKMRVK
jgi:phosphate transport system permease protein